MHDRLNTVCKVTVRPIMTYTLKQERKVEIIRQM